jgi:hypothetical protein
MQRDSSFSPLSLLPIALSAGCYWFASFFHGQYAHANGIVALAMREAKSGDISGATLVGLPSPDTYFGRAESMSFVAILVCVLALVIAMRHKHWADWLAAGIATAVAFAIPMYVLWRS